MSERAKTLRERIQVLKSRNWVELLKRKIEKRCEKKKKAKLDCAVDSDQYFTPPGIKQFILKQLRLTSLKVLFDPCPPKPDWNAREDYDALFTQWLGIISFVNPPYSNGAAFVTKAVLELLQGRSSVSLVMTSTLTSKFGLAITKVLGQEMKLGQVKFINGKGASTFSVSLLFLLTPEMLDYVERARKDMHHNNDSQQYELDSSMLANHGLDGEKREICDLLFAYGATVKEASLISTLRYEAAN